MPAQLQGFTEAVDSPQMPQNCPVKEVTIQTLVWESFARGATMLEVSAKSFHRKGPVAPNRAPALDVVCKVKEGVNGKSADWKALRVPLIVDPAAASARWITRTEESNSLIVPFYPINETRLEHVYLRG